MNVYVPGTRTRIPVSDRNSSRSARKPNRFYLRRSTRLFSRRGVCGRDTDTRDLFNCELQPSVLPVAKRVLEMSEWFVF